MATMRRHKTDNCDAHELTKSIVKLSITRKSVFEELSFVFNDRAALFGIHLFIYLAAPVAWSVGARLLRE